MLEKIHNSYVNQKKISLAATELRTLLAVLQSKIEVFKKKKVKPLTECLKCFIM